MEKDGFQPRAGTSVQQPFPPQDSQSFGQISVQQPLPQNPAPQSQVPQQSDQQATQQPHQKKLLIPILFLLILFLGIGGYFYYNNYLRNKNIADNSNKSATENLQPDITTKSPNPSLSKTRKYTSLYGNFSFQYPKSYLVKEVITSIEIPKGGKKYEKVLLTFFELSSFEQKDSTAVAQSMLEWEYITNSDFINMNTNDLVKAMLPTYVSSIDKDTSKYTLTEVKYKLLDKEKYATLLLNKDTLFILYSKTDDANNEIFSSLEFNDSNTASIQTREYDSIYGNFSFRYPLVEYFVTESEGDFDYKGKKYNEIFVMLIGREGTGNNTITFGYSKHPDFINSDIKEFTLELLGDLYISSKEINIGKLKATEIMHTCHEGESRKCIIVPFVYKDTMLAFAVDERAESILSLIFSTFEFSEE